MNQVRNGWRSIRYASQNVHPTLRLSRLGPHNNVFILASDPTRSRPCSCSFSHWISRTQSDQSMMYCWVAEQHYCRRRMVEPVAALPLVQIRGLLIAQASMRKLVALGWAGCSYWVLISYSLQPHLSSFAECFQVGSV